MHAAIRQFLDTHPALTSGTSRFAKNPAWFTEGKEIAHLHTDGVLDLRLGRQAIRARRPALEADSRVLQRASTSDWIEVTLEHKADLAWFQELLEAAIAARLSDSRKPR